MLIHHEFDVTSKREKGSECDRIMRKNTGRSSLVASDKVLSETPDYKI